MDTPWRTFIGDLNPSNHDSHPPMGQSRNHTAAFEIFCSERPMAAVDSHVELRQATRNGTRALNPK
jgi:hypothetical protein